MIEIDTVERLKRKIDEYAKKNYLFRGQTKNYSTKDYNYSFQTSFQRNACIPSYNIKWQYYSHLILNIMLRNEWITDDIFAKNDKYIQALMQHYGWRSFFIDVSSNPLVSLFFAGYQFKEKKVFHATEDCYEEFLIEIKNEAEYIESKEEVGYLYVIDLDRLRSNYSRLLVDLCGNFHNHNLRMVRQCGYLLSDENCNLNDVINDCIVEVLKIKSEIITKVCNINNIDSSYLFPSNDLDYIYNMFLSMPRKEIVVDGKAMGFFEKPLIIPEYNINYNKFQVPEVAYYTSQWIFNKSYDGSLSEELNNPKVYKCLSDIIFHITPEVEMVIECPDLLKNLDRPIIIEFDNIFRGYFHDDYIYQKAILVKKVNNLICCEEIGLEIKGKTSHGFVGYSGIYFEEIDDNHVKYIQHEEECKCGNYYRHFHSFNVAVEVFKSIEDSYFEIVEFSMNEVIVNVSNSN